MPTRTAVPELDGGRGGRATRRVSTLLDAAILALAVAAPIWLGYQLWRLLFQTGFWGAVDLSTYHRLVGDWFAGRPVYADRTAIHPPATYLFLWPFVGWLPFEAARWLWAIVQTASMILAIRAGLRWSGATSRREQLLVALLFLGTYPAGANVGNGQIGIPLLAALLALALRLEARHGRRDDLAVALLLCVTLVKPTISAPIFLLVLLRPAGFLPAVLAAAGYLAATLAAIAFRAESAVALFRAWLGGAGFNQLGTANLHAALTRAGLGAAAPWASLAVLALLGLWLARHRRSPVDVSFAIAAIVARLFTYHRWYDDVLLLLPLLVLFRLASRDPASDRRLHAGVLFGSGLVLLLAPGGLYLLPAPWNGDFVTLQVIQWLAMLVYLGVHAERQRGRGGDPSRLLPSTA